MKGRDVLMLSEAHVTAGEQAAWKPPTGYTAKWSVGTAARAGVGLLLRDEFLSQFDPDPEWEEPVPGRAALLKLRGDKGALDIWTLYFATGNKGLVHANTREEEDMQVRRQRQHMRQQVAAHLSDKSQVLSISGGDFNWVTESSGPL